MTWRLPAVLLALLSLALSAWRLTFPDNLDDMGQSQQGLYVLDILQNRRFMLPREKGEIPASKPPLYNWVAAGLSRALGGASETTIKLPAVLSAAGVVAATVRLGAALFSVPAGALAGLVLLSTYHFTRLSVIARTDMMLALWVLLALIEFHRVAAGPGRTRPAALRAWVFLALASLTKGPVGLAVALVAVVTFLLLAGELRRIGRCFPLAGVLLLVVVFAGWFVLALLEGGDAFYHRVVVNEMWQRVTGTGARADRGRPFHLYFRDFPLRFTPFSVFALASLWLWRRPGSELRRPFLFVAGWFLGGFVFFTLSSGKRADYLLPLYPAAALLAALPFARAREEPRVVPVASRLGRSVAILVGLAGAGLGVLAFREELPGFLRRGGQADALGSELLARRGLVLAAVVAVVAAAALVERLFARRRMIAAPVALAALSIVAGLVHVSLPTAEGRQDAVATRDFAARLRARVPRGGEELEFYGVRSKALLFHLGLLKSDLPEERLGEAVARGAPVVTTSSIFERLKAEKWPGLRALEVSAPRARDEGRRLVLFRGGS